LDSGEVTQPLSTMISNPINDGATPPAGGPLNPAQAKMLYKALTEDILAEIAEQEQFKDDNVQPDKIFLLNEEEIKKLMAAMQHVPMANPNAFNVTLVNGPGHRFVIEKVPSSMYEILFAKEPIDKPSIYRRNSPTTFIYVGEAP
jgi:hypothetical protein